MSDLESYLTSKLNGQYGLRYQQLLDELRAIQKIREVPESRLELTAAARSRFPSNKALALVCPPALLSSPRRAGSLAPASGLLSSGSRRARVAP